MPSQVKDSRRKIRGYRPPHCPNPACRYHTSNLDWHFVRNGKKPDRRGRLRQRYLCRACGRDFCAATFSTSYWLRKPHLLRLIAIHITEGNGIRQTARILGVSHTTVMRHVARLHRHCLLFHQLLVADKPIAEALVFDGFESFAHSQFAPFHANLAAGSDSWFLYHFTLSPLRRKGSMTPGQKRKRAELERRFGRPDPKAVEQGIYKLLKPLLPRMTARPCVLHSDDHPAYQRALRRLAKEDDMPAFHHLITSSKERRTQSNPLFAVNLDDLLLRHGSANHRRETIAFSKILQASAERFAIFMVWRDYVKKRREKAPGTRIETAAMRAGMLDRALTWKEILRRRLFPSRVRLPAAWRASYWGRIPTPFSGREPNAHRLRYAF
jgi:transposase-like protein